MGLSRAAAAGFLGLTLLLTGCSTGGDEPPAGSTSRPSSALPTAQSSSQTPTPETETPRQVPSDQRFGFDETAQYDDGLQIEIAGTVADRAKKTDRGAEATHGQIVIASVRIENGTKQTFAAPDVLISAGYGNGTDAQIIIDPTNQLQSGFGAPVKPGDEAVATVGFAMPFGQLGKVTFVVDPNDDVHDPVSFTGKIAAPSRGS
jgi:hypothetical protein